MSGKWRLMQPPETQNLFVGMSIFVAGIWMLNVSRRCYAVLQLRQALGTRRLVAIRGAGRRVQIFRLLGRNYLQRTLARNHLQALVHTRQAYPPKTMPCTLMLATPRPSGGVKAILQTVPDSAADSAAGGVMAGVDVGGEGMGGGAGPLVGLVLQMECRVACTVELLWDVDLAVLGMELNVDGKLPLLPASTRPGAGGNPTVDGVLRNSANGYSIGTNSRVVGGGSPARLPFMHAVAAGAHWMLAPVMRVFGGSGQRVGGHVNRVPPPSQSNPQGGGEVDEETGGGAAASGDAGVAGGRMIFSGVSGQVAGPVVGGTGMSNGGGGTTWTSGLGRRKSVLLAGGAVGFGGNGSEIGGTGRGVGDGCGTGGAARGTHGYGRAVGGWGKRTAPRVVGSGSRSVFKTAPGDCYFRVGSGVPALVPGAVRGTDGPSVRAAEVAAGGGGGDGRRAWPSVRDSVPAGRCSLAVVIRGGEGAAGEIGDAAAGWRHRPTHRVAWQVLLVQLKEQDAEDGVPPQAPSAQLLRHLVAVSKGEQGDAEAVYSFAEVFGAGDEQNDARSDTDDQGGDDNIQAGREVSGALLPSLSAGGGEADRRSGGRVEEPPEECVICLTDPKDTLLLPCRHLCVCSECFRHVDKCPVCRSAFDNYIVIQSTETAEAPVSEPAVFSASSTAVGVVGTGGRNESVVVADGGGRDSEHHDHAGGASVVSSATPQRPSGIFAISRQSGNLAGSATVVY